MSTRSLSLFFLAPSISPHHLAFGFFSPFSIEFLPALYLSHQPPVAYMPSELLPTILFCIYTLHALSSLHHTHLHTHTLSLKEVPNPNRFVHIPLPSLPTSLLSTASSLQLPHRIPLLPSLPAYPSST
ncbi:hypothetical protein VKT23_010747 [Stygiomarasmius scandens]|uniref:Uncharacterized protein n=1 Tax=Marasmiellus scandens TaxID=2682957 RepID=A0ABR1JB69_9AGAR